MTKVCTDFSWLQLLANRNFIYQQRLSKEFELRVEKLENKRQGIFSSGKYLKWMKISPKCQESKSTTELRRVIGVLLIKMFLISYVQFS